MPKCPIVETSLGKVKGRLLHVQPGGKQVYNYTSLPFAKPPVGELRFEPPCRAERWDGILDGTIDPSYPIQDLTVTKKLLSTTVQSKDIGISEDNLSEDCLYLSVYTTNPSKNANLPVMFGIYGGGFQMGGESVFNGKVLSSLNDVVVVVPNYRVGLFGFLSMGKGSVCPGNMGLLDQVMALKWTKENILSFGGNPDNVTIFGESAGGMSVNYHVYSPLSRGLFHKAISNSGAIEVPGFPIESLDQTYEELLQALKVRKTNERDILAQLKTLPAADLVKVGQELVMKMKYFTAVVDGNFFPDKISDMISKGNVAPVPYLLGTNSTEGHGAMNLQIFPGFKDGISEKECKDMVKMYLGTTFHKDLPATAFDIIIEEYQKDVKDDKYKWSKVFGLIYADILFNIPLIKSFLAHAKSKNPTYVYHMKQALKYCHDPDYGPECARKASFCECDHGDDVVFTLGLPLDDVKLSLDVKFSQEEKDLSREWMKYLTNFAKNGNPNVGVPVKVEWPSFTSEKREYLSVHQPCSVASNLKAERFKFWKEVIGPMQKKE